MLLQLPQLLSALLTISTSRSWLLPTLSIMRLHAYLAQAVVPGDDRSRWTQLPGILAEDVKELESQVAELEDLVSALGMKDDNRLGDIKKAAQHWGRIELVEASFKGWQALCTRGYPLMIAPTVIGERVITPSAIVFLVIKVRISLPLDDRTSESPQDIDGVIEANEEKDNDFLTSLNDAEDLPEASRCGLAHAPYWPTVTDVRLHIDIFVDDLSRTAKPGGGWCSRTKKPIGLWYLRPNSPTSHYPSRTRKGTIAPTRCNFKLHRTLGCSRGRCI